MTWYNDGVPQFSTVHPTVVAGASTQSNASSTSIPLSHDNYEVSRLAMALQTQDNGLALTMAGKNILVLPIALEKKAMEKYLINPKIKVTPLKLAPRQSPDEPSCVWEFKMEE